MAKRIYFDSDGNVVRVNNGSSITFGSTPVNGWTDMTGAYGDPATWTPEEKQAYSAARNHQAGLEAIYALRQRDEQREYESPVNQAQLTREAGINPDLVGVQTSGEGTGGAEMADALQNANAAALQQQQQQAAIALGTIGQVAQIGGLVLSGFNIGQQALLMAKQRELIDAEIDARIAGAKATRASTAQQLIDMTYEGDVTSAASAVAGLGLSAEELAELSPKDERYSSALPALSSVPSVEGFDDFISDTRSRRRSDPAFLSDVLARIASRNVSGEGVLSSSGSVKGAVDAGEGSFSTIRMFELDNAVLDRQNYNVRANVLAANPEKVYDAVMARLDDPVLRNNLVEATTGMTKTQAGVFCQQNLLLGYQAAIEKRKMSNWLGTEKRLYDKMWNSAKSGSRSANRDFLLWSSFNSTGNSALASMQSFSGQDSVQWSKFAMDLLGETGDIFSKF